MIKRQVLQTTGTVTGTVVKVHNDFWVEVKLKSGNYEGFAPNARSSKDKAFMDGLKALQPGDTVTIQFTTDSERHRILALKKK
jgi:preprotein translocase subunit YajC